MKDGRFMDIIVNHGRFVVCIRLAVLHFRTATYIYRMTNVVTPRVSTLGHRESSYEGYVGTTSWLKFCDCLTLGGRTEDFSQHCKSAPTARGTTTVAGNRVVYLFAVAGDCICLHYSRTPHHPQSVRPKSQWSPLPQPTYSYTSCILYIAHQ